jgi:uncharacterized protein (AIM24 family)
MTFSSTIKIETGKRTLPNFTGPGEVVFASALHGDIVGINVDARQQWHVCDYAIMLSSRSVLLEAVPSPSPTPILKHWQHRWTMSKTSGNGILWVTSHGKLMKRELARDERCIIAALHVMAFNCAYVVEKLPKEKPYSRRVFKFTGPGMILMQAANVSAFAAQIGPPLSNYFSM